jgi:hypothetical protein
MLHDDLFDPPSHISIDVLSHTHQHTASTLTAQPISATAQPTAQSAPYTAQQIADRYPDLAPKEVTVRTRWFDWLTKVAPEPLLKTKHGFTDLAAELFDDFVQHCKIAQAKPELWVQDAKARYAQEWESAGVIEAELMPPEVGGQLALAQTKLTAMTEEGTQRKEGLLALIKQAKSARANLSEAEIETARQRGANRAVAKFEVELLTELETEAQLRQALEE